MSTKTAPITYEESFGLPENPREEVVRGESRVMSDPTFAHYYIIKALERGLEEQLSSEDYTVVHGNSGICKAPFTYRIPDLMVLRAGFRKRLDNSLYVWETPELIVECLSPSNRKGDLEELLEDYRSIGTPEIWLIRPEARAVEVYQGDFSRNFFLRTPLRFAEAEIPLDLLWKAWDDE